MNVADLFTSAADELDARGWQKHDRGFVSGAKCAMGAFDMVLRGKSYHDDGEVSDGHPLCVQAVSELARMLEGTPTVDTVTKWNNAAARTAADVTATMRACAAIWRAKHEESVNVASVESSAKEVVNA